MSGLILARMAALKHSRRDSTNPPDEVSTPSMDLNQIMTYAATAIGGGGVAKALDFLATRSKNAAEAKAYTMGAVDHAVSTALASVTTELERVNRDIGALRDQHSLCEVRLEASERDRRTLHEQVQALMAAGRIAQPGEVAPR